jgi:hypothetical protein
MPGTRRIRLGKPALLVAFFVKSGSLADEGEPAVRMLRARWRACELAGMTADVPGLGVPMTFPRTIDEGDSYRVVAARRSAERQPHGRIFEAFLFSEGELAGLVALLAPNDPEAGLAQWAKLFGTWRRQVDRAHLEEFGAEVELDRRRVLAEAQVFTALYRAAFRPSLDRLCTLVRGAVPDAPADSWWRAYHRTQQGFMVWDGSSAPPERDPRRTVCILAPSRRERDLDTWIWSDETPQLMPFTRYLVHAAKLGYEARVHHQLPSLARVRAQADAARERLHQVLDRFREQPDARQLQHLLEARAALRRAQTHSTDLVVASTQLRELRRTAEIAKANMLELIPPAAVRGVGETLFERDQALVEWLLQQAESDLVYLDALRERSGLLLAEADARVQEGTQHTQERLMLLQTSLVTALLTGLTATQTLGFRVPVPPSLRAPLVVGLTALALAVPVLVFQASRLPTPLRPAPGYFPVVAALGAAAGWIGSSASWWVMEGQVAPAALTAAAAVAGATLALLVGSLAGWRNRQIPRPRRRRRQKVLRR